MTKFECLLLWQLDHQCGLATSPAPGWLLEVNSSGTLFVGAPPLSPGLPLAPAVLDLVPSRRNLLA